jgi:hypothetical protein
VIARTVVASLISLFAGVAFVPAGNASVLPSAAVTKPDRTRPQCHLALPSQRPAAVRGSGLRVVVDCSEAVSLSLRVTVSATTAKRLKLHRRPGHGVVLGTASRRMTRAGKKTFVVRLGTEGRRAFGRLRGVAPKEFSFAVSLLAKDRAGNRGRASIAGAASAVTVRSQSTREWKAIVDDRFDSGGIPSHWHLYDGPYGSGAHNCATPRHAWVAGGAMHMRMGWEAQGLCGPGWYTAGMMIDKSLGGYSQRVDVRWRAVSRGVGSRRIVPMRWPENPDGPSGGEEDYCEGNALSGCAAYLHYAHGTPGYQQVFGHRVDLRKWHTMSFRRQGSYFTARIDSSLPVWTYMSNAKIMPSMFKRTVLQQECHLTGCPSGVTGTDDIEIDWIRIYNPA